MPVDAGWGQESTGAARPAELLAGALAAYLTKKIEARASSRASPIAVLTRQSPLAVRTPHPDSSRSPTRSGSPPTRLTGESGSFTQTHAVRNSGQHPDRGWEIYGVLAVQVTRNAVASRVLPRPAVTDTHIGICQYLEIDC